MKLNEILDSVINGNVKEDEVDRYVVQADIGDRTIEFDAKLVSRATQAWDIEFYETSTKDKDDVLKHKDTKLTGSGNQFQVLAFVMTYLAALIKKRSPAVIEFVADNGPRANIYGKLARKFEGYEVQERKGELRTTFKLVKKS